MLNRPPVCVCAIITVMRKTLHFVKIRSLAPRASRRRLLTIAAERRILCPPFYADPKAEEFLPPLADLAEKFYGRLP